MFQLNELILGFDARLKKSNEINEWDENRKNSFLFRLDISQPYSVDQMVWPSINSTYHLSSEYIGFYPGLWSELDILKDELKRLREFDTKSHLIIAVMLHLNIGNGHEKNIWENMLGSYFSINLPNSKFQKTTTTPSSISKKWSLLGYDVCDASGTSGLTNCGFLPEIEDVNALRNYWTLFLNRYHLFFNIDDALAFKKFSDQREKKHAPFFVFSIWLIPNI